MINVIAADGGVHFTSTDNYDNSSIALVAQNKDYLVYVPPICPNYFMKTDTGFEYKSGTEANKISIFLTGYTIVNFND